MAGLTLSGIGKVYADGTRAVEDLNVQVEDGEFLVFVGPSGCGKTTALRMIAGLEVISEGELRIGDRVVNSVPPRDRDVAMVFQSYALYPHLSVRDNIAFGLKLRKMPKPEIRKRVEQAAQVLGLTEYLDRKPRNLSGGQRQRVAMGRAIVREPQVFLMDEPLSNLDAKLRVQMRTEIARIQRDLAVTTVYVTHDQTEAMTLGDRVAVMKKGALQQIAPPQELYDRPANIFVAGFIGSPAMNLMTGTLHRTDAGEFQLQLGSQTVLLPAAVITARPALSDYVDRPVVVGVRPEDMDDATLHPGAEGTTLRSVADLIEPLGSDLIVHLAVDAEPVRGNDDIEELAKDLGQPEPGIASAFSTTLVARFNPRSTVTAGQPIDVRIDTERLHYFDQRTGLGIWAVEPGTLDQFRL
ncbi:MAG: ABC transporter ATP-binding protein [Mycobacteriaceae bacterium]